MTIFRTKLWIPASILMTVLATAIVVIIVFQIRITQLNKIVADLNGRIAVGIQSHDDASSNAEALKADNKTLRSQNESLSAQNKTLSSENEKLKQYQLTLYVPSEHDIVVDQQLDPELVKLITKHVSSIETGDIDAFKATLINKESAYLLGFFNKRKNTDLHLTAISAHEFYGADILGDGPFYLPVTYRDKGELHTDYIGVTKITGNWIIYDYD